MLVAVRFIFIACLFGLKSVRLEPKLFCCGPTAMAVPRARLAVPCAPGWLTPLRLQFCAALKLIQGEPASVEKAHRPDPAKKKLDKGQVDPLGVTEARTSPNLSLLKWNLLSYVPPVATVEAHRA